MAFGQAPAFSPLYQQIKSLILQSLQQGEWKPGRQSSPASSTWPRAFKCQPGHGAQGGGRACRPTTCWCAARVKGTFVATHAEQQVQYRFLRLQPDHGSSPDSEGAGAAPHFVDCKPASARQRRSGASAGSARRAISVLQARRVLSLFRRARPSWRTSGCLVRPLQGPESAERLSSNTTDPMYALFEAEFGVRMVRADEKLRAVAARFTHRPRCSMGVEVDATAAERRAASPTPTATSRWSCAAACTGPTPTTTATELS
jgi:GntR family transcriptional regulator